MGTQKVSFKSELGHHLAARLDSPETNPVAFAIFAHCFTCSKSLNAVRNISNALTSKGIAVLQFDFTGLGESGGDFSDSNFSSNLSDLTAAAAYLSVNYQAPALLIGHSLGGTAVLSVAGSLPSVKAIVTIGAPADPEHVLLNFNSSMEEIYNAGKAEVALGGRTFTIKQQFIEDVRAQHLDLSMLNKALLILHSPRDETVSIDHAATIYKLARHPKSFISLNGADHLLTDKVKSSYAGNLIAAWVQNYLPSEIPV